LKNLYPSISDHKEYLKIPQKFGNKTLDKTNNMLLKKELLRFFLKEGNTVTEIEKVVKTEKM